MPTPSIITLTTDFGSGSAYVAAMKGSILTVHTQVRLVDLTHDIPPQSIREGALALEAVVPFFPQGSIHVAVVDPGVGSARRLVYAEIGGQHFLAPDNGLLSLVARRQSPTRLFELTESRFWRPEISPTFHGRDILGPVAAHLSRGIDPASLGPAIPGLTELLWNEPRTEDGRICGEVLHIDRFGNLVTNVVAVSLPTDAKIVVRVKDAIISGLSRTYSDQPDYALMSLIGSTHRLEIAIHNGNAALALSARVGDEVLVEWAA